MKRPQVRLRLRWSDWRFGVSYCRRSSLEAVARWNRALDMGASPEEAMRLGPWDCFLTLELFPLKAELVWRAG